MLPADSANQGKNMTVHMQKEIDNVKTKLLNLCAAVEKSLCLAVQAIKDRDSNIAKSVIDNDTEIDLMEVDLEEECLKILALHQPVAIDLRFLVTALKINNDLERIGDLAVNIAERGEYLITQPAIDFPFDLDAMAQKTQWMLTESLDALVDMDAQRAHQVCNADDDVDLMHKQAYIKIQDSIVRNPKQIQVYINLVSVSRQLERIADHTTNIAEDVIYMVEGRIVRHKAQYKK